MKGMNGEAVAKELNITRQAVCQILRRAMRKVFYRTKELYPQLDSFQVARTMAYILDVDQGEFDKFYKMFPRDVKKMIEKDAIDHLNATF